MERLFYSPTLYAKKLIEDNEAVGAENNITEINYLFSFDHLHQNNDYDNYYVKPLAIKVKGVNESAGKAKLCTATGKLEACTAAELPELPEDKDILINITKSQYGRMKLINDKDPEGYICLRTDTTTLKTFNSIDGDHEYYPSKILLVPSDSTLHKQLDELVAQRAVDKANHIDIIEDDFTL